MRRYCRISLVVTVALLLFVQSGCQEQTKAPDVSKTKGAPRIIFEDTLYDFGEVSSSRKYTGQFKFTNTGNGILKIINVKKCCGIAVKLDKKELGPGESGTLKVDYYTGRNSGLMNRELSVYSNDETNPKMALTIKARVVVRIDYKPRRIDLLPNKENAGCPKITITSLDKQPFSITSFQSTGEIITADIDASVEATKFILEPKVFLQKLQNNSTGLITIGLTHPEHDRLNIRFTVKPRFQLTPPGIILLNPQPQEPSINKVSIVNNYDEDFEIESTSSEKSMAKVINQQAIKGGYRLEVEITPPPPDDETRSFEDVLNVNLKGGETLAIKCYVRYLSK